MAGTSEVIVVSYGIRGKNALKQLMLKCINVIAVCDNDKNVRKQKMLSLPRRRKRKKLKRRKLTSAKFVQLRLKKP